MKLCLFYTIFFAFAIVPGVALAAQQSPPPGYEPSIPTQFSSQGGMVVQQFPEYLPNGAVNLDEAWILDGGARLYWNSVRVPQQINLAGQTWIDPASVPLLFPQKQPVQPRKRYYRRRAKVAKVKVPPNVASTALKSPAIPLPVTPVQETETTTTFPPLKAPHRRAAAPRKSVAPPQAVQQVQEQPIPAPVEVPRLQ